jgi:hypothetical protein
MSELDLNWHPEHCPWLHKNSPWKTEAAFWAWLRGGLRNGVWNKHPLKLEFIKEHRERIPGKKEGTTRWGGRCNLCRGLFGQNELQVDHVEGNVSLRSWLDVLEFVQHMASPGELQPVCKACHKAKNLADRNGTSFEEALIEKETIAICKLPTKDVLEFLKQNGYNGSTKNAKERREGVKNVITNKRISKTE